jgi:pimeloyl-[acyl-carrier protein] methyl ester esterase
VAGNADLNSIQLVLLPGLDGTGNLFADFKCKLPENLHTITTAYPTQQFLTYPELVAWLGDIVPKDGRYAILAESYGTPLAVKFAATNPPNLVGVILIAGFISDPARKWRPLAKLLAQPLLYRFRPPDFMLNFFAVGAHAPRSLKNAIRGALKSAHPEILAKRVRAVRGCDATEDICHLNVPLLYLQATEDELVGKESLEEIQRLRPETISISIRGPHLLLQREPRVAADAVAQFLISKCAI